MMEVKAGNLKWFDIKKGFGFIVPDDGGSDVFVHATTVQEFDHNLPLLPGTWMKCAAEHTQKGWLAKQVLEADASSAISDHFKAAKRELEVRDVGPWERARVKWFNRCDGFGFVTPEGRQHDVFVHIELLKREGVLACLEPGQAVDVRYGRTEDGLTAVRLQTLPH